MFLFILAYLFVFASGAEFTLPGKCPTLKLQDNFDFSRFSGTWYTTAAFASDGRITYDCAIMEINEDNVGYTLRESYVEATETGDRVEKNYFARVDPTFDAKDTAKFIVSHEDGDKVLQFPFVVLSTDYDSYAIAYTCQSHKKKPKMHYVYTWILSRENTNGIDDRVEDALSQYPELVANRQYFVTKDFNDGCASTTKLSAESFTNNFW